MKLLLSSFYIIYHEILLFLVMKFRNFCKEQNTKKKKKMQKKINLDNVVKTQMPFIIPFHILEL